MFNLDTRWWRIAACGTAMVIVFCLAGFLAEGIITARGR